MVAFSSFMNQKYRQSPWIARLFCKLGRVSMTTAGVTGAISGPRVPGSYSEMLPETGYLVLK